MVSWLQASPLSSFSRFSSGRPVAGAFALVAALLFAAQPALVAQRALAQTPQNANTQQAAPIQTMHAQQDDPQISFGSSGLQGISLGNPTSLQFGPDGRLYVSQQSGELKAFAVERGGANDYAATSTETIDLVQNIPNHNDDGTPAPGVDERQVTGIVVAGTAANPVLYVSSSDPRIGAGGGGSDLGLDTNSGIISKLTCTGGIGGDGKCQSWDMVHLVRGLPRSEENHSTNGMQLDEANNVLLVTQGGHTNAGAPSNNFAKTTEYALAAAVLEVDLGAIEAMQTKEDGGQDYKYDLPTLDDPARSGSPDAGDPFGGNDGLNQAKIVAGGPVQVYSPGYRNPYDLVLTKGGKLYVVDNGANGSWGGYPQYEESQDCTNDYLPGEPGSTGNGPDPQTYPAGVTLLPGSDNEPDEQVNNRDNLHYVSERGYYAGHPNPVRANPTDAGLWTNGVFRNSTSGPNPLPADWPAVPESMANPVECDYRQPGEKDGALYTWPNSTNGLAEYTASNFDGALSGNLLAAEYGNEIFRVELNGTGDDVTNVSSFASNFGSKPLDVVAQGDDDPFGGTVWAATYGSNNITVFEPADYDGGDVAQCSGADDPSLDEDGDGYDNAVELDAGTDPCSAASKPADFDNDGIADIADEDDDNDGRPDTTDPFAIDADNGTDNPLPVEYEFFNATGFGFGDVGFTGLMTNGTDYLELFDPDEDLILGGTSGLVTNPTVGEGDAYQDDNSQVNALQFGVAADASTAPFTVEAQMNGPFGLSGDFASQGIYIGNGGQDNYLKLVLNDGDGSGGFQVLKEVGSSTGPSISENAAGVLDAENVVLYLSVNPAAGTVQAKYSAGGGPVTEVGSPVTIPDSWLDGSDDQGLAVGIIATSTGPAAEFGATWDYINVTKDPSDARALVQVTPNGGINASTFGAGSITIENTSSGGAQITGVTFSTSTAALPDLVFDPNGDAGDQTAKPFTVDSEGGTGQTTHDFSSENGGGFEQLEIGFDDFGAGETFGFSVDMDPTSITGVEAPGPGESGSVSGLELSGGAVTVTFSDGTTQTAPLFRGPGDTDSGSQSFVRSPLPAQPSIGLGGGTSTGTQGRFQVATVSEQSQTVTVDAPSGAEVHLLELEAALFEPSGGGIDIDPYEANSVTAVSEQTQTVDGSGAASFDVTLAPADANSGATATYNYYLATVENADGAHGPTSEVLVVEYDPSSAPAALYRVNAGGNSYTDESGNTWSADDYFSGSNGTYSTDAAIAGTENDQLYQTERYGGEGSGTLSYNFPVSGSDGPYTVDLLFAEIFQDSEGGRVFDVMIEGETVLSDYDLFADVGANTAVTKTFTGLTDDNGNGTLDITFDASVDNAKISAIAVQGGSSGGGGNEAPQVEPIANQTSAEGDDISGPAVAATDPDAGPENLTYSISGQPAGVDIEPTNGQIIGAIADGAAASSPYNVTVTVSDGAAAASESFTWTVTEEPTGGQGVIARVNAGGDSYTDDEGNAWSADQYFDGGTSFAAGSAGTDPDMEIAGTDDDVLYRTERSSGADLQGFSYSVPVPSAGTYTVNLRFAEIYFGTSGGSNCSNQSGSDDPLCANDRVFSVNLEGGSPPELDSYDLVEAVGTQTAVTKTYSVEVTDGTLDIDFTASANQPKISAIEVLGGSIDNEPPTIAAIDGQTSTEGESVSLQVDASDPDGDALAYSAADLPPGLSIDDAGLISGIISSGGQGAFQEEDGLAVIEMESGNTPGGWVEESSVDGYTGSGYLHYEGSDHFGTPGIDVIEYQVEIQNPGTYRFQWRSQAGQSSSTEENDSWLKIQADSFYGEKSSGVVCPKGYDPSQNDCEGEAPEGGGGDGWFKVYVNSTSWSWQTSTSDNDPHDIFAEFGEAGTYTIQVSGRSVGHTIDRMVLHRTGPGDPDPSNPTDLSLAESEQGGGAASGSPYGAEVTVADGKGGTATEAFEWTVNPGDPSNNAPVIAAVGDQTVAEGQTLEVTVSATDDDGDAVTFDATSLPDFANLRTEDAETALLSFIPEDGDAGSYEITVSATDGNGGTDSETFTLAVTDPAAQTVIARVNAGGPEYTDNSGNAWSADQYFTGGQTYTNEVDIAGTENDALYQTERYGGEGGGGFSYAVPLSGEGSDAYTVNLLFAELYQGVASGANCTGNPDVSCEGQRVFDVVIEGETVLSDYDIFADVGAATAVTKTFTDITDANNNGEIDISFSASADNAKISAIEVLGASEPAPNASAAIAVNEGAGLGASTYTSNSFSVENTGDVAITSVSFDLTTALLPDVVFDPTGTAGDSGAKCFTADSGADAVGLTTDGSGSGDGSCSAPFSQPHNGTDDAEGYDVLTVGFDDFQNGESFGFSVDMDPTSIKGDQSTGDAGSISGFEIIGSTATVTFADGSSTEIPADLWQEQGSLGGAQTTAAPGAPEAPAISLEGASSPATVSEANQTVNVSGPAGATVSLVRADARLYIDDAKDPDGDGVPGYDTDAFEANEVLAKEVYTTTLDGSGNATVDVTLTQTESPNAGPDGGLNYFLAVTQGDGGLVSLASNKLVLEYDPNAAPEEFVMQVGTGWELVGLPLSPSGSGGATAGELFSGLSVTGGPFGFAGGQYTELEGGTPLEAGEGYWVRFADGGEQPVEGTEMSSVTLSLAQGWNLISGPSCDVPFSSATGDPGVLIGGTLTGYDGGAYTTDAQTLEQGEGYWVRASEAGTVSFACSSGSQSAAALAATSSSSGGSGQAKAKTAGAKAALEARSAREATAGFDRLTVSDAAGRSQTLYFGARLADDGPPRVAYSLPALPPGGGFDARFAGDSRLAESSPGAASSMQREEEGVLSSTGAQEVRLQAESYPLEVTIRPAAAANSSGAGSNAQLEGGGGSAAPSGGGGGTQVTYLVEELTAGGQVVATHELVAGESSGSNASGNASGAEASEALRLEVSDESVTRLRVERRSVALPEGFAVAGNYPNPVRSGGATTVELDLPEAAEVTLEVYDMLGRRVMQVGPERLSAGPGRTLEVPVGSLSSGVYLYRARARLEGGSEGSSETATDTGKFTVVR